MSDLVLQAEQLTKHYSDGLRDIEVLTDLNLAISAGEWVAVVGVLVLVLALVLMLVVRSESRRCEPSRGLRDHCELFFVFCVRVCVVFCAVVSLHVRALCLLLLCCCVPLLLCVLLLLLCVRTRARGMWKRVVCSGPRDGKDQHNIPAPSIAHCP